MIIESAVAFPSPLCNKKTSRNFRIVSRYFSRPEPSAREEMKQTFPFEPVLQPLLLPFKETVKVGVFGSLERSRGLSFWTRGSEEKI